MVDNCSQKDWQPLESNPALINKFITNLGFDTKKYLFHEMLSIEEWGQALIPFPTKAVLFLYPIHEAHLKYKALEVERIRDQGQEVSPNLFFMRQYARNACGTIAAIHALVNLGREDRNLIMTGSFLDGFFHEVIVNKPSDPEESGRILSQSEELHTMHTEVVQQGSTRAEEQTWDNHFVCFIEKDGNLYELDGSLDFPLNHGSCEKEEMLFRSCEVIKEYMNRDPNEIRFTVLPLAPPDEDFQ